jgi:hypothetical protein
MNKQDLFLGGKWLTVIAMALGSLVIGPVTGWSHSEHNHAGQADHSMPVPTMDQQIAAMEAQLRALRKQAHQAKEPAQGSLPRVAQMSAGEERLPAQPSAPSTPSASSGDQGGTVLKEGDGSHSIPGAFPGVQIPTRPRDFIGRSGAQPMDTPREMLEPDDPQKAAVLQRRSLMSRFNPAFGLVIDAVGGYNQRTQRLQGLEHDAGMPVGSRWPSGFYGNIRDVELFAAADIDTFARAYAVITAHPESLIRGDVHYGSAVPHVEEAAIQTTSLPYNLSIRAGRFFADFGYIARRHAHDLPFIDRPGSVAQLFSEAQADGVELTWLAPTPFFLKFTGAYASRFGEVVHDPLSFYNQQPVQGNTLLGKVTTYYDINDDHNLEIGYSIAHSDSSRAVPSSFISEDFLNPEVNGHGHGTGLAPIGPAITRRIMDIDFHYRWYPLGRGQRQSLSLHGEIIHDTGQGRRDPLGNIGRQSSWGGYAYVEYRINKQWRPGFRFDYHQMLSEPELYDNPFTGLEGSTLNSVGRRTDVRTYSPYLTYYMSETNRLRLQYNRVSWGNATDTNMVLLQWTVVLGSHVHGFTERD